MVSLGISNTRNMTMEDHQGSIPLTLKRTAWNKGKLIGAKPPLWPKHVWSIRTKLQIEGRIRDLAVQSRHRQQTAGLRRG